jgi:CubicO group peptidase (beta-lactamase class C family)
MGQDRMQTIERRLHTLIIPIVVLITLSTAVCSDSEQTLDSSIIDRMEELKIPGLAAVAIDSGRVVWMGTYGWANIENQDVVTPHTPFMIASVSKTITAIILMTLYADGHFELDDDINEYLPFSIRNPNFPLIPISFRNLLRHRSGIADDYEGFYKQYWNVAEGDPTISLDEYLESYLDPEGADYSSSENFLDYEPGDHYSYCNTCYALLGFLAQQISGSPFEQLSQEVLFQPLQLEETGWFLRDLGVREPAMPYGLDDSDKFVPYGHNGYPDWPAGQLRTSITDLSRILSTYLSGGEIDGDNVINPGVIEILSPVIPDQGFHTWRLQGDGNGDLLYSHTGSDIGIRTIMMLNRINSKGVIVLTNGEAEVQSIANEVYKSINSPLIKNND